ncbi:hypothetical protein ACFWNQ_24820 [Streptomyces virginiae]|uniref:hypothetical protein n=1 Tax=Streptomyces virginiae TaxID=1961 RepID=UPI00365C875B
MSYDQTRREAYVAAVAAAGRIVATAEAVPTSLDVEFLSSDDQPSLRLYFHLDVAAVEQFAKQFGGCCTSEVQGASDYTSALGEFEGVGFTAWTLVERAA